MRALLLILLLALGGCADRMSELHQAAFAGDVKTVHAWAAGKRNLDVTFDEPSTSLEGNASRMRGITPLMLAAAAGQLDTVKALVEGGAALYAEARPRDEVVVPDGRRTAFDYAVENTTLRGLGDGAAVVAYLWEKSDRRRFAVHLPRQIAATCQRHCNDASAKGPRANPALFLIGVASDEARGVGISEAACYSNQPTELLAFLERNGVGFPRNTLHCAAFQHSLALSEAQRIAIAAFFLDHGADIEYLYRGSATALMGAAARESDEMVAFLLSRGANPNTVGGGGFTALSYGANHCTHGGASDVLESRIRPLASIVERLVQAGAQPTLPEKGVEILKDCCARQPQVPSQRRVCRVFGL